MKKLFLLDAYALIFRAYYAFITRPIKNSKGLNTSAIYGFTNTLDEVLRKEKPSHIAVAFDPPMPCFRKLIYSEYKANRQNTPEDIKLSIPYIKDIIKGFNIPILEVEGFEADDVIGTVAKKAEEEGFEVYIMTPDKDLSQMISNRVFLYKPRRSAGTDADVVGLAGIKELFEIDDPKQVIDILALWGDASDNVPGAPGIGEKTAKSLISKYQSIDGLYTNIDSLKGKVKETLINYKDQIETARTLVTVRTDIPININFNELEVTPPDTEKLRGIFNDLEFRTLITRILGDALPKPAPISLQKTLFDNDAEGNTVPADTGFKNLQNTEHNYLLIDTEDQLNKLLNVLEQVFEFSFDTVTDSLHIHKAQITGISFSANPHEAYYVPIPADREEATVLLNKFKNVFENPKVLKISHNIKFDVQVMSNYGISIDGKIFDTMIAHYLVQPELSHNIDYLSRFYLKYSPVPVETLLGPRGNSQLNMRIADQAKVMEYACENADVTFQLGAILKEEIKKYNLERLANEVEMPLVSVLADMEKTGFKLNINELNEYAKKLNDEADILEKKIFGIAGCTFNISSPKQLGEILFTKLNIASTKRTKTKQYSTNEEVLLQLKDEHEIVELILEYRGLKKLTSTYVEAFPKLISSNTGKIHTCFEQAWVATGRLSSKNPNLQNIPIRDERGREIRKSFISSGDDYVILAADYSQIELRLMAHISGDENMIEAFISNEDIHSATASKIYNIPIGEVSKEMRRNAKTANFGIIYGISSFGLSQRLHISKSEAKELIDGYFRTYKKVKEYMENSVKLANEKGYVETLMGRRRYVKEIHSANAMIRGNAERNAINAPLQGSAADIIKLAMVKIQQSLSGLKTKMILQVHDELIFDVYKPELDKVKDIVKNEMQNVIQLSVPLVVDIGIGNNWFEAH